MHPFDEAIALAVAGPDTYTGHTSPAYWNMVGPFGGITAATALNAVLQHPSLLGEPVSLTVNYASALVAGPFTVTARAVRTNRSTQHWVIDIAQADTSGVPQTVSTATAMTAVRRATWSGSDAPMPAVPAPHEVESRSRQARIAWINRYDMRQLQGPMPRQWDGAVRDESPDTNSLTQLWMRDDPPRALDFCSLAAFADIFYPRVYLRRASAVPAGTVSMTVYFHATGAELRQCGTDYLLGQARGQAFHQGFFDQSAQLWRSTGQLLVTSAQLVYYKE